MNDADQSLPGKKRSLKEQTYDQMLSDIATNEFQDLEILNEKFLTERYGVSRSTVRDALTMLCNEGILRTLPRFGYQIIRLNDTDIREIIEFRLLLEVGCLERIIAQITAEEIEDLRQFAKAHGGFSSNTNIWKHWKNNAQFHLKVNSYYRNRYVSQQLESCIKTLSRAYAQALWNRWHHLSDNVVSSEHIKLVDAIQERDYPQARQILIADIRSFVPAQIDYDDSLQR